MKSLTTISAMGNPAPKSECDRYPTAREMLEALQSGAGTIPPSMILAYNCVGL